MPEEEREFLSFRPGKKRVLRGIQCIKKVFAGPAWKSTAYQVPCLVKTWGRPGFPALRIWMHSPSLQQSHADLRQGVKKPD